MQWIFYISKFRKVTIHSRPLNAWLRTLWAQLIFDLEFVDIWSVWHVESNVGLRFCSRLRVVMETKTHRRHFASALGFPNLASCFPEGIDARRWLEQHESFLVVVAVLDVINVCCANIVVEFFFSILHLCHDLDFLLILKFAELIWIVVNVVFKGSSSAK